MNKAELHTLIVWSNAFDFNQEVEKHIKNHFNIISVFDITWSKNLFLSNYRIFYSHSQKHKTEEEYTKILLNKIKHCGNETFRLFVYEDTNPVYDFRITSSGNRKVNSNVFDLKSLLREKLGGGHKIHASDNTFESNKDLTLILGKNSIDFQEELKTKEKTESVISLKRNCTGSEGYTDINELFYVLNNTIDYCVLRNYECLPEQYTLKEHGDIDLLVENLNYAKYLTNAQAVFPHLDYRVHYMITIAGEQIPFDFRYVGDEYYDIKWQLSILKNKQLYKDNIYILDATNYFYSLLYHAYVQKPAVKEDYHERLNRIGKSINIEYNASITSEKVKELLDKFLVENQYQYTIAKDSTVYYNKLFVDRLSKQENQYGQKISQTQCRYENQLFFSEVYLKDNIITKVASKEIIDNEVKFLKKLAGSKFVPEYICHKEYETYGMIQMKKIEGKLLSDVGKNSDFWSKQNIITCVNDGIEILKLLAENNILHRDIRSQNLMFNNENGRQQLFLIDFGWAVAIDDKSSLTPFGLGSNFKFGNGQFSDAYSMGKTFNSLFKKFSLTKGFPVKMLMTITADDYSNKNNVLLKITGIHNNKSQLVFTLKDYLILVLYRNPFLMKVTKRIVNK